MPEQVAYLLIHFQTIYFTTDGSNPLSTSTKYEGPFQLDLEKPEIAQQGNKEGEYQFYTRSDNGSKLFINGQLVVNRPFAGR